VKKHQALMFLRFTARYSTCSFGIPTGCSVHQVESGEVQIYPKPKCSRAITRDKELNALLMYAWCMLTNQCDQIALRNTVGLIG